MGLRLVGFEPTRADWKSAILPLNDSRYNVYINLIKWYYIRFSRNKVIFSTILDKNISNKIPISVQLFEFSEGPIEFSGGEFPLSPEPPKPLDPELPESSSFLLVLERLLSGSSLDDSSLAYVLILHLRPPQIQIPLLYLSSLHFQIDCYHL